MRVPMRSVTDLLVGHTVTTMPLDQLREHPENAALFGEGTEEEDRILREDLREHGQTTPMIAAGFNGELPFATLFAGGRRRRLMMELGYRTANVVLLDGITAREGKQIQICDNLAGATGRKIGPKAKHDLLLELAKIHRVGQGRRTDLHETVKGETAKLVANAAGTTVNAVRDLTRVFAEKTPSAIKDAVNAGKISVTRGADLARDVEKKRAEPADVAAELAKQGRVQKTTSKRTKKSREHVSAKTREIASDGDRRVVEKLVAGRTVDLSQIGPAKLLIYGVARHVQALAAFRLAAWRGSLDDLSAALDAIDGAEVHRAVDLITRFAFQRLASEERSARANEQ
jgi:hypothetical protein